MQDEMLAIHSVADERRVTDQGDPLDPFAGAAKPTDYLIDKNLHLII
jgi:hypothetical protein